MRDGALIYFQKNQTGQLNVPVDYTPQGFDGSMFHTGHLRGFTIPIKVLYSPLASVGSNISSSTSLRLSRKLTFLDANSWSFNYGHYMIDNVIPAFTAAKVFNIPFVNTQQLIETNCRLFSTLEPAFSEKKVDYNHSMGTYRQACLRNLDTLWPNFFDHPPMYLDQLPPSNVSVQCFRQLVAGQGSTFGLKSLDLTRAIVLRDFRDFVLNRLNISNPNLSKPNPRAVRDREKLVVVGLRVAGSAGGVLIKDLCGTVKRAMSEADPHGLYRVECLFPSELSFQEEIIAVRRARILVSVHGTISYLSLFSQDYTQQLSIASPKELKENQILPWASHFRLLYLTWNRMDSLAALLGLCVEAWQQAEADEEQEHDG